jgi:preprotein translocase subunit SecD
MIDTYLKYGFAGAAVLFVALGVLLKNHRYAWWTAAASAAVAGISAHYDSFWMMAIGGLSTVWALACTTNTIDLPWRAKAGMTLAIGLGAFLCVWPTLESLTMGKVPCPQYIKDKIDFRLVAGLDLRGGLRLVYTVDVEEAIKDKRNRYFDDMRAELATVYGFKQADKTATREELDKLGDKVTLEKSKTTAAMMTLHFKDAADISKLDGAVTQKFNGEMVRSPGTDPQSVVFKIRTEVETSIRERAVSQAKETIGRRVDELGLREAAVTVRDEDIIIEVPGQDEKTFAEIREIISKTARLEFKLVDDTVDFFDTIRKTDQETLPQGLSFFAEEAPVGPGKTNRVTQARMVKGKDETMRQARDRMKEWLNTLNPPSDHEFGIGLVSEPDEQGSMVEIGWRTYYLYSKAEITGDQIRDAQAQPDQGQRSTGGWLVALSFTESGATRFEQITGENVQKRFAIILDDNVESAPRILAKISGGHATITMGSSDPTKQLEDSRKLELVLRSGALPAPITPSNEQRIGASLGTDSIRQGIYGALAGSALVLVFMAFYYHVAGVVADFAVLFNLFIQIAVLSTFGAAMTLPGIAGLALTIGMAIDANILINERIREEIRNGKSPRTAVDMGYDKALSAIIDGHMTTFISGLILAQYGTGPIKGFAVTLLVGMVVSLFTSIVCTRLAFDWWVRGRKVKTLNLGLQRGLVSHGNLQARSRIRLHGHALLLDSAQHLPPPRLDLRRRRLPGPQLRHRLQGRDRGRDRLQEAHRRRQGPRGDACGGLREPRRRRGLGPDEPEPVPDPRPGGELDRRGAEAQAPRLALLRRGADAGHGRMPRGQAPHRGEVQPRRRQDRASL